MDAIIGDTNHPRHHFVPVAHSHDYSASTKENHARLQLYPGLKGISYHLCLRQLNFLRTNCKFLLQYTQLQVNKRTLN